jgi:hypothetical protein
MGEFGAGTTRTRTFDSATGLVKLVCTDDTVPMSASRVTDGGSQTTWTRNWLPASAGRSTNPAYEKSVRTLNTRRYLAVRIA